MHGQGRNTLAKPPADRPGQHVAGVVTSMEGACSPPSGVSPLPAHPQGSLSEWAEWRPWGHPPRREPLLCAGSSL